MNHCKRLLRGLALAAALAAAAFAAAAADDSLHGAGATFPAPVYARWAAIYKLGSGVDVRYDAIGSGTGIERIERGQVDFGASDVPLAPAELRRIGVVQFPAVVGGVVPVVNIGGVGSGRLRLTGQVLGDIYLGKIKKWDHPAIAELNPGLNLPGTNITVVHRSDSSGTSFLWSSFLSRSNPEWKTRVGAAMRLDWPIGVADVGNEGVASSVQRTKTSIGYVEYAYAKRHHLATVLVRNRDGAYVAPGHASFAAAAAAARWHDASDLQQSLIDSAGAASWPITGASFILLRTTADQPPRSLAVMKFFDWAFRRGKRDAVELDYAALPDSAIEIIGRAWTEQVRRADGGVVWPAADSLHP
jgi:phosphate transport system substrate-binding protein